MTVKERMKELIEAGAAITVLFPVEKGGPVTLLLAGAAWLAKPPRLRWCAPFPEHDGHVHETHYGRAALEVGGRDIGFYENGEMIMYVCPIEESGEDINAYRNTLLEWRNLLDKYNNAAEFAEMIATPREDD